MPSHSAAEREALAAALADAGPASPTLCDGWTTTDLAAHLVARERRPDAALGLVVAPLASWTDRVQGQYSRRAYAELIDLVRNGPTLPSVMALPGVDAQLNLIEHFVHCEDVRRALPGWGPRDLPPERQAALWGQLTRWGKMLFRASPVSVALRTPDGLTKTLITRSGEGVVIVGHPSELTLYAYGRKDQSDVQLEGPDDAVDAFRHLSQKF